MEDFFEGRRFFPVAEEAPATEEQQISPPNPTANSAADSTFREILNHQSGLIDKLIQQDKEQRKLFKQALDHVNNQNKKSGGGARTKCKKKQPRRCRKCGLDKTRTKFKAYHSGAIYCSITKSGNSLQMYVQHQGTSVIQDFMF